nr:putative ribonuclease H-like domain-containing protein [Tanacetum cinerariifolium]
MLALDDVSTFDFSRDDKDNGVMADMNNLDTTIQVSPNPTTRIHKDHHLDQVIGEVKTASTPMETQKPLLKDEDGEEVDVHMYRSMIGSLMYLTSSRPDIMFVVCACARYQVNLKVSHLHAMKRIFRVLDFEKTKTTQALEIDSLKRGVKKLKKKQRSGTHKLKRLYNVGLYARVESSDDNKDFGEDASKQKRKINDIDVDEDITLVNDQDAKMFDVTDLHGEEVFIDNDDANKEVNDEVQKVVEKVVEDINTTKLIVNVAQVNAAGEINAASIATTNKVALKLQVEFDEEEQRLPRESAQKEQEVKSTLIEEWNDNYAKIDADYQLAQRLQAEEQQELTDAEEATLFMQFLEKRRKFFAAKAAEEKRNKPPTQDQQRKIMCTYLKNIEGKKLKDLKNKSFDYIQKMFDKAFKRVKTFKPVSSKSVE